MAESETLQACTEVVLVTGLSGAGKSSALKVLEDLGYEAVDNLPLALIGRLLEPVGANGAASAAAPLEPMALSVDIRTRDFAVETVLRTLEGLRARLDLRVRLLFLDCDDEILARRYTETRRRHPLADDRPMPDGIALERRLMSPIRDIADLVLDTSGLSASDLKRLIGGQFRLVVGGEMTVSFVSFSYRRGLPREADLVFDVRFLANPHYVDELRPLTGRDVPVAAYIARDPACEPFLAQAEAMLRMLLPQYQKEGKSYLTVAIGCTGGRHRSVFVAEELAGRLGAQGRQIGRRHRDLDLL